MKPQPQNLGELAQELVGIVLERADDIREGIVMTVGPPPYRRLDCDGRALAYIRVRPRKKAVRVDISGLWVARCPSPLRRKTASGSATLFIRNHGDVVEAARFLLAVVEDTRRLEQDYDRRRRFGRLPRRGSSTGGGLSSAA